MLSRLSYDWRLSIGRGGFCITFGILALIWPDPAKVFLFLLFGTMILLGGILTAGSGIAWHGYFDGWWAILLRGLTSIIIGLLAFYLADSTFRILLILIAVWGITTGILEIVTAIRLRRVVVGEWTVIVNGLLSILTGMLLFAYPMENAAEFVRVVGIYAIVAGAMVVTLGIRKRSFLHELEMSGATLAEEDQSDTSQSER